MWNKSAMKICRWKTQRSKWQITSDKHHQPKNIDESEARSARPQASYFFEDSTWWGSVLRNVDHAWMLLIERNSSSSRTTVYYYQPLLLLLLQFSSGNTLDFDELFIGVRSGPALYCFDVTNDDGSSSSMALMELKLKCLHKKSATCSTTNIPL